MKMLRRFVPVVPFAILALAIFAVLAWVETLAWRHLNGAGLLFTLVVGPLGTLLFALPVLCGLLGGAERASSYLAQRWPPQSE
jgi:hypothetical protein